jgi:hypothetical protein
MLRCLFYDHRERIYRALGGPELDTFPGALAFMRDYLDRTEGRPMKSAGHAGDRGHTAVFVLTDKEGATPPTPPRQLVGSSSSPTPTPAPSGPTAEDLLIQMYEGNGHTTIKPDGKA